MQTYPNQRMVKINRERVTTDFLGIKNCNWKAASQNLRSPALLLYLYLASNADGFNLALSPAAIRQEIGMPRSTYHDQFHILVDKGYLVPTHGNTYEFYEVPQPRDVNKLADGFPLESNTSDGQTSPQNDNNNTVTNREINNTNNSINNRIDTKETIEEKQRTEVEYDYSIIPIKEFKF